MKYYSQIGQDKFINEHFKGKTDGTYLDIGAGDGKLFSNTLFFEELGWKGVCFEPNQYEYRDLMRNRTCKLDNRCIWNKRADVEFMQIAPSSNLEGVMLSGITESMDDRHFKRLNNYKVIGDRETVNRVAIPLNSVFIEQEWTSIDYCSIDTEGSEFAILKAFDFDKYTIKAFSIENNYGDEEIREFMKSKGYKLRCLQWDDLWLLEGK